MDTKLSKMRKAKIIFYVCYFTFFVISIYFAISTNEMFKQFGMFGFLRFLKYWIVFGMLLMLSEWIIENIHIMQLRRNTKKQDAEILSLKAELYSFLHDAKKADAPKADVTEIIKSDESSGNASTTEPTTPDPSQKS